MFLLSVWYSVLKRDLQIKMVVVLGELGGRDEYSLVEALKQGKVTKPVVAWVSGTCARLFKSEVQFGHAVSFHVLLFYVKMVIAQPIF